MSETNYPMVLDLRIDWSELDYFGHVNNVSFFKYIQAARVNYWERIGLTTLYDEKKQGPMLVSCKCDFRKPLFYPGKVVIRSGVSFLKNTSFGISHRLLNDSGETIAAADDVVVMYDYAREEKMPVPQVFRAKIAELENREY